MNRRRQYRVTADFEKYVSLELLGPKVHARNVRLLDLSSGGCGVELPAGANGMLRQNDTVNLRVISSRLPEAVDMKGTVAWLKEATARPQVGLVFVNWRQHRILLDSELKGLFNEREAFRVTPDGRKPVDVELQLEGAGAGTYTGTMRDVSLLGLGVSVSTKSFTPDETPEFVTLSFRLPDVKEPVEARAEVRYLRPTDGHARAYLGLRMVDAERLPGAVRRVLQQFIMQRQRVLCRMGVREVS